MSVLNFSLINNNTENITLVKPFKIFNKNKKSIEILRLRVQGSQDSRIPGFKCSGLRSLENKPLAP
jgi:hypothetical protein